MFFKNHWINKTKPLLFYNHSQADLKWTDGQLNGDIGTFTDNTYCIIILERYSRRSVKGILNRNKKQVMNTNFAQLPCLCLRLGHVF